MIMVGGIIHGMKFTTFFSNSKTLKTNGFTNNPRYTTKQEPSTICSEINLKDNELRKINKRI